MTRVLTATFFALLSTGFIPAASHASSLLTIPENTSLSDRSDLFVTSSTPQDNLARARNGVLPVKKDTDFTAIEIVKPRTSRFKPSPSAPTGGWSVQPQQNTSGKEKEKFCLLENNFKNGLTLLIAQRVDGYSTVGVNYSIDMLQKDKDYSVRLQLDESFDENFSAYARTADTLVVQMGKKASFFSALASTDALHISMPGLASTFSLAQIGPELDKFSDCLRQIGGDALAEAPAPNSMLTPAPATAPALIPAAPVTQPELIPTVPSAPVPPVSVDGLSQVTSPNEVQPAATANWSDPILAMLTKFGVSPTTLQKKDEVIWLDPADELSTSAERIESNDILLASVDLIDQAEQACGQGKFTSQMGVPEENGGITLQPMESKCEEAGKTHSFSWILQKQGSYIIAWIMEKLT